MKLVSDATTLAGLRDDLIRFIEMRAEQNRSAEQCYRGKAIKKMYLHAASELQSVADDLRFLEIR